jgi:hypothetical protein
MKKKISVFGLYFFVMCVILVMATSCAQKKSLLKTESKSSQSVKATIKTDSVGKLVIKIDSSSKKSFKTDSSWYEEITTTEYDTTGKPGEPQKKTRETTKKTGGSKHTADNDKKLIKKDINQQTKLSREAKIDSVKTESVKLESNKQSDYKWTANIKWIVLGIGSILLVYYIAPLFKSKK